MSRLRRRIALIFVIGLWVSSFVSLLPVYTQAVYAAAPPTFKLSANQIAVSGGFVQTDVFNAQGRYGGTDRDQVIPTYVNETTRELYFIKDGSSNVYITHVYDFLNSNVIPREDQNAPLSAPCYTAIEVAGSSGTFVGVNSKTNQKSAGCTSSVQKLLVLNSTMGLDLASPVSDNLTATYDGVTVPACTNSSDQKCVAERKAAIQKLNGMSCSTSTPEQIAQCEARKDMVQCLNTGVTVTISDCRNRAAARQILSGDTSAITADTTDTQISQVCKSVVSAADRQKCTEAATAQRDKLKKEQEGAQGSTAVCAGGALGWVLCPLTKFLGDVITVFANVLEQFMRFDPLIGSVQGDAVKKVWDMVVGIANLLLVVAFLVVIFSQATSIGLSAYGIKKMLPRIIAAAILINLSFYVCAITVDAVNIIGASTGGIIQRVTESLPQVGALTEYGPGTTFWQMIVGFVTALGAGAVLAHTGAIAFIVPIFLSAALSVFVLLTILTIRHVLTLLLVMISPLAFAAMILPNTDGLFKKWWKALYVSLFIYPLIMGLAYGSMLVSKIILMTVADPNSLTGWFMIAIAFFVLFAWIVLLKTIVSWGFGFMGRLAGMINDPNKGLIDKARRMASDHRDMRKNENRVGALRYDGGGNILLKPYRTARKGWADITTDYRARQGAAGENLKDQQRKHIINKVTGDSKFATLLAGPRASEQDVAMMTARYEQEEDKMHAQTVSYVQQGIRRQFNSKDRDSGFSGNGINGMVAAARAAAARGDQTTLDALFSHAASGGADEYAKFHTVMQNGYDKIIDDKGTYGPKNANNRISDDMFKKSMAYVYSTSSGELAPKSPSLATVLQQQKPEIDINTFRSTDPGMLQMYNKVSAEKHAAFSSDEAKTAARFINDKALKELVENPGGKHSLGAGAAKAYQQEYDKIASGTREFINGEYTKKNPKGTP